MEKSLTINPSACETAMIQSPNKISGVPTAQEMMVYNTWAKTAVESQMYRGIGKEAGVMMIMLAAREYGIGPAQALNGGLHIIEGKVELSARVMSGLIRRSGHQLKIEDGEDYCKVWGKRNDTGEEHEVKYTMEMAQRAGLIKDKGGWKKTQEDMLYNRAMSRLARRLFSDVIGIGYVEGEIIDSRANGEVLEAFPETNTEPHDQELLVEELYGHFDDPEDKKLLGQFISEVMQHYKWSYYETIKKLLPEVQDMIKRFQNWKNKRKVNSEKVIDISPPSAQ